MDQLTTILVIINVFIFMIIIFKRKNEKEHLKSPIIQEPQEGLQDNPNELNLQNDKYIDAPYANENSGKEYTDNEGADNEDLDKKINEYQETWRRIKDEEEVKEAQNIYKKIEKDEEQKTKERYQKDYYSNKAKTNTYYNDCEMLMSEYDYLYENYSEIEIAKKKDIAELIYQGYIENEDDEYFPEELYYYLNND